MSARSSVHPIARLQKAIGNQAVLSLLRTGVRRADRHEPARAVPHGAGGHIGLHRKAESAPLDLARLVGKTVEEIDGEQSHKVLIQAVMLARRGGVLKEFTQELRSRHHAIHGDYLDALLRIIQTKGSMELRRLVEEDLGKEAGFRRDTSEQVMAMSQSTKLYRAALLGLPDVPEEFIQQIVSAVPIMVITMGGLWALSHLIGVGEIADLLGIAFYGAAGIDVVLNLKDYHDLASSAHSETDLRAAGNCLARAAATLGVVGLIKALGRGKSPGRESKAPASSPAGEPPVASKPPGKAAGPEASTAAEVVAQAAPEPVARPGRIISERRAPDGIVIDMEVGGAVTRLGLEQTLPSGTEVGLPGWQRAHSVGPGLGAESGQGIRYAPPEVNLEYQNSGIERFIREFNSQRAPNVRLYLRTVTETHPNSLRLKSITYRLSAARGEARPDYLFEVRIEIQNATDNPRVTVGEPEILGDLTKFLAPRGRGQR